MVNDPPRGPGGANRLIAGEEEARRRLARELHDDHCQRLAALSFELKAVRGDFAEGDPRRIGLDAVGASLAELGEDLRRLSHDLHPAILERRGLAEALRDHCAEVERRHGLPVRLSLRGPEDLFPSLPSDVALGLYRIVQEALANTVRHAGARSAHVTLRIAAGEAHLAVADDGAGFDPEETRRTGGLGLAILEERAEWLGGRCRIASAPGAGTEVDVAVPLPEPAPEEAPAANSPARPRFIGPYRLSLKALAVDPAQRYPTVDALGQEVRRVLRGEPIEAGPPGALHRLGRFVRRHRPLVVSAALILLALAMGLTATTLQARRAEQEALRADAAATFLEDLFKASDPRQARGEIPDARELLRRGTGRLGRELHGQPLLRARLLDTLGGIHTDLGLYDDARPLLTEALAIRERLRGPEDPEVADTLVRLGSLTHLSRKGDAVPLFRRALAIREKRLGPEDPEVASVLNNLGTALAAQGRFDEAETTLRRTLALQERLWGGRDPRVAKTLHNLGGIAYYRGRTADAERLLQRALAIKEQSFGTASPQLVETLAALASLHLQHGRYAEAEPLYRRLLTLRDQGAEYEDWDKVLADYARLRRVTGKTGAGG